MKVLVIQHKMIGDVLTTSLLFELLRAEYPEAQLDYLVNSNTLAVVKGNPFINNIWAYFPKKEQNNGYKQAFFKNLQSQNYNLIIDVYSKFRSAGITLKLRPKQSISYYKWYTFPLYTKTVKPLKESNKDEGLAIVNRVLLLETLGIEVPIIPKPKIYLSSQELATAKAMLASHNLDKSKPLFMIGVLGSSQSKTYPLPYLAQVLDELVTTTQANILLNYIPNQLALIEALMGYCNANTINHIHAGIYGANLREFLAITTHCDALIGNEGGAVNMAKALGIPTFAIYSPWILKQAWNSYEQDGFNKSVHLIDVQPELYNKHPKKYKKQAPSMYKKFTPKAVNTVLAGFLRHHKFID